MTTHEPMRHGTYTGPDPQHHNKGALLRPHPKPDKVYAQFDALYLPTSHGWHEFDKNLFVNVTELSAPPIQK